MKVTELLEAAFALLDEYDFDRELDATPPALFFSGGRERLMALINLASAELWGVNNRIRMAFGLPRAEYTSESRVTDSGADIPLEALLWPALAFYTAASAVMSEAPKLSARLRDMGNIASREAQEGLPPGGRAEPSHRWF
ncbi:MAG: hypothetical protein GX827_05090 [Clostridiales bacterium]|jgi:hypothetical protein|nr:hypothetical protein [Clostridiales bacterium]